MGEIRDEGPYSLQTFYLIYTHLRTCLQTFHLKISCDWLFPLSGILHVALLCGEWQQNWFHKDGALSNVFHRSMYLYILWSIYIWPTCIAVKIATDCPTLLYQPISYAIKLAHKSLRKCWSLTITIYTANAQNIIINWRWKRRKPICQAKMLKYFVHHTFCNLLGKLQETEYFLEPS